MAWTPDNQVIDPTRLVDNLLEFLAAHCEEALEWAGSAEASPFAKYYSNAAGRLQTIFPSLMVLAQSLKTDFSGDLLIGDYRLVLEATLSGADADELVALTRIYTRAVESMLMNIPSADLTANSSPGLTAKPEEVETRFDIIRGQQASSAFLQIVQTEMTYKLYCNAF